MVGSTFYIAERQNEESLILAVRVVAEWGEFIMIEGTYPTGDEYLAVVKPARLFQSEQGAMKSVA